MKLTSLYNLLSIFEAPSTLWNGQARLDARKGMIEEAEKNYDLQMKRNDMWKFLPSLELVNVHDKDHDRLTKLGASQGIKTIVLHDVAQNDHNTIRYAGGERGKGNDWIVSAAKLAQQSEQIQDAFFTLLESQPHTVEHAWFAPNLNEVFQPWWREAPKDLQDEAARKNTTAHGLPVESYKLIEDEVKGGDSTALPIMYAAIPLISCLAFVVAQVFPLLGLLVLVLTLPFAWTIAQSEGMGQSIMAVVLSGIAPLLVAGTAIFGGMGSPILGMLSAQGMGFKLILMGVAALAAFIVIIAIASGPMGGEGRTSILGGFAELTKKAMIWGTLFTLVLGVLAILEKIIPGARALGAYFFACCYPMIYSEGEYIARVKALALQGNIFAGRDKFADNHFGARESQARRAAGDKTPLFHIAKASGYLTDREFGFAPDAEQDMCLSVADACQHVLVFGATGSGKTTSFMRPRVADLLNMRKSGYQVGLFVDDGKGALGSEVAGGLDLVVRPGMPFAYFEGLKPQGLVNALMPHAGEDDGKNAVWVNGARILVDHAVHILWAFVHHEKVMRENAVTFFEQQRAIIKHIKNEILIKGQHPRLLEQLKNAEERAKMFESDLLRPRKWYWHLGSLNDVILMANQPRQVDGKWTAGEQFMSQVRWLGYQANEARRKHNPVSIHPDLATGYLSQSIEFFVNTWPTYAPEQRSSFMLNVVDRIQPLMRGTTLHDEHGAPWYMLEKGTDITQCLRGKAVTMDLPPNERDGAGVAISMLNKQKIYQGVTERFSKSRAQWEGEGGTPLLLLWDEAQLLVSDIDLKMLPVMRSAGCGAIFSTQGFDSLMNAFGNENKAVNFANTFQSLVTLRASPETYAYMAQRLGEAKLTSYIHGQESLHYAKPISDYLDSPLNDRSHPLYVGMRRLEKLGAGQMMAHDAKNSYHKDGDFSDKSRNVDTAFAAKALAFYAHKGMVKKEVQPLFQMHHYQNFLIEQGQGIVYLLRGGVPRVDLATFPMVDENAFRNS